MSRKRWARNGITVEHVDEVGDALRGAVKSNKPTVINMMLTQELGDPFRRDAFRQPSACCRSTASSAPKAYNVLRCARKAGLAAGFFCRLRLFA